MSVGAYRVIRSAPTVFVRTARHPAVQDLAAEGVKFESFDHIYQSLSTFEEVYSTITNLLLEKAEKEDIVYAVPGHPLFGEAVVRMLIERTANTAQDVCIVGSESFIEASLTALRISFDDGLKVLDALSMDYISADPQIGNLIYQVYDRTIASNVKLKLMEQYPDEFEIFLVLGGNKPEEQVNRIPLFMLDRVDVDHLTSAYIPPLLPDKKSCQVSSYSNIVKCFPGRLDGD